MTRGRPQLTAYLAIPSCHAKGNAITHWETYFKARSGSQVSRKQSSCNCLVFCVLTSMETGIACYTRGAFLPSVPSKHSTGIVSPPSLSPSFSSRVWKNRAPIQHMRANIHVNLSGFTFVLNEIIECFLKGCMICMTEFEIKLTFWGVIKSGAKIITESFEGKELFPCNKMWDWG